MNGVHVIDALKKKFHINNDSELAKRLGITGAGIVSWKKRKVVTPRQIASLVNKASIGGASNFRSTALRPLVEFYSIEKAPRRGKINHDIFSISDGRSKTHPYKSGLQSELNEHHGVYLFFDSRGQVIYAGKAKRLTLWREINNAFNRKRGDVQTIKRVRHPLSRVQYKSADEKSRQIRDTAVPLHEIAKYFSAYVVDLKMIDDLEAMLVRSFANDLLNVRMERFERYRANRRVGKRVKK
jgi:hypothetical protein